MSDLEKFKNLTNIEFYYITMKSVTDLWDSDGDTIRRV